MANFKDIYKMLKNGSSFKYDNHYIGIGTSIQRIDYGKEYIFCQHYGSFANKVSFEEFLWIVHDIFKIKTADEFLEYFTEE